MGNAVKRKLNHVDDVFKYKMNKIRNIFLNNKLLEKNRFSSLVNLFEVNLFKSIENKYFTCEIKKEIIADWYLDYLIGFYSQYTTDIELYINDIFICKQKVYENSYTELKCNPVPIYFLLQNHEILNFKIFCNDSDVFDLINDGDLNFLGFCSCYEILGQVKENKGFKTVFFCSKEKKLKHIFYTKKVALKIDDYVQKSEEFQEIPMIHDFTEEYKKYLAKKTCDIIRDELLMITMNPNRIKYFLTNDEKNRHSIQLS